VGFPSKKVTKHTLVIPTGAMRSIAQWRNPDSSEIGYNTKESLGAASLCSAATKILKVGSCRSGELFFASAFLFTASAFGEGGEKRTTAKNKRQKVPF